MVMELRAYVRVKTTMGARSKKVRSSVLFSCMTMDRGWRIVRGISLQGLRGHRRQETDRARWIRFVPFMLFIFSLISCFLFFGKKKAGRHGSDSCLANSFVVCRCGWPGRDRQGSRAWPVEYEQAKPSHRHPSCRTIAGRLRAYRACARQPPLQF